MVVEALSWWSRRASQHPAVQSPMHPWKRSTNLARSPLHVALVGTLSVFMSLMTTGWILTSALYYFRIQILWIIQSSAQRSALQYLGETHRQIKHLPGTPIELTMNLITTQLPVGHGFKYWWISVDCRILYTVHIGKLFSTFSKDRYCRRDDESRYSTSTIWFRGMNVGGSFRRV